MKLLCYSVINIWLHVALTRTLLNLANKTETFDLTMCCRFKQKCNVWLQSAGPYLYGMFMSTDVYNNNDR